MHLCLPPKILQNHRFQFLLSNTVVIREVEDNGHIILGGGGGGGGGGRGRGEGVKKVHYGICENGEWGNIWRPAPQKLVKSRSLEMPLKILFKIVLDV